MNMPFYVAASIALSISIIGVLLTILIESKFNKKERTKKWEN